MKVIYLTWGETPRSYGVFGSQAIGQFYETYKLIPGAEFHFVSAVPIVHSGLVRERLSYCKELKNVKKKLQGIRFHWLPIYAPQNFINSSKLTFWLMHVGAGRQLKKIFTGAHPDIVHCRSYHAAWAALQAKENYELSYKVIFDGRGLWPEEVALKKGYVNSDANYLFLKEIEREILSNADVAIGVSDPMVAYYSSLGANCVERIYLSAFVESNSGNVCRKHVNSMSPMTLGYVGALSDETWHKPKYLLELYNKFKSEFVNTRIIIVTTSNHEPIRHAFTGIPQSELLLTSTKTVSELGEILKEFDFSALSYFIPEGGMEEKLSEMVLAVKTAEYLSAGIPVLVNKYCGGAASIILENNVGISYDPLSLHEICKNNMIKLLESNVSVRAKRISREIFDYSSNAKKYREIYLKLAS